MQPLITQWSLKVAWTYIGELGTPHTTLFDIARCPDTIQLGKSVAGECAVLLFCPVITLMHNKALGCLRKQLEMLT